MRKAVLAISLAIVLAGCSGGKSTTSPTSESGACSSQAGNWSGSFSGTNCYGSSVSGSWSMTIKEDCSVTGKVWDGDAMSGSLKDGKVTTTSSGVCGTASLSATISGNGLTGSYTKSAGGSGSWSGSKQ